jgi:hypothetical protein
MESTANKEVHIELEEYGLHPEHIDYEPLSITRIKKEYSLPDRSLHVNNNPFYFGVENCSTDGICSFQPYYSAEIIQRLTSSESLLMNNFEELMTEMMVMTSIESL